MTSLRSNRKRLAAVLLCLVCFSMAGCDPYPLASVEVLVRAEPDGTAVLAARVDADAMIDPAQAPDSGEFSADLIRELGLGEVLGEPRVFTEEFRGDTVGVAFAPTDPKALTIDLGSIATLLIDRGVEPDTPVVFSVCNAAGVGGASGRSVTLKRNNSCGVVLRQKLSSVAPKSSVTLRPVAPTWSRRLGQSLSLSLVLVVLAAAAGVAVYRLSPRYQRGREVAGTVLGLVVIVAPIFALMCFSKAWDQSVYDVDQQIDEGSTPWGMFVLIALAIAFGSVVGGIVQLARNAGQRATRRAAIQRPPWY